MTTYVLNTLLRESMQLKQFLTDLGQHAQEVLGTPHEPPGSSAKLIRCSWLQNTENCSSRSAQACYRYFGSRFFFSFHLFVFSLSVGAVFWFMQFGDVCCLNKNPRFSHLKRELFCNASLPPFITTTMFLLYISFLKGTAVCMTPPYKYAFFGGTVALRRQGRP